MSPGIEGLYVITDEEVWGGDHLALARAAVAGGARVVQLRDKRRSDRELLPIARAMAELCRSGGALFVVDDRCDLAVAAGADGVHVGRHDLPVEAARAVVGPERIVGVSCYGDVDAARAAECLGADYVAVGAIHPTPTKEAAVTGVRIVREVRAAVAVPVVAIGGLTLENVGETIEAGADAAAVVSAVARAPDPAAAVRELVAACRRVGRRPGPAGRAT